MIILFRHGEGEHNIKRFFDSNIDSNVGLTDNGKKQVEISAKKIKSYNFNNIKIYSSPLLRTRETSRIISDILNIEKFIIDHKIREVEMGLYDGKTVDEFPFDDIYDISNAHVYKGENFKDIDKRVGDFLNILDKDFVNIIVSHGSPIMRMYNILTGFTNKVKTGEFVIILN